MNEKAAKVLGIVFSGIGGVILTLLCQYLLAPQSQAITFIVNGQELYVTEEDYLSKLDANDHLRAFNEKLQAKIETLQAENIHLRDEIAELQQTSSTVSDDNSIIGTVWLRNNENINGCPQVKLPEESQISGQTTYEMMWESFENATTYRISMWKDANYGTADSNIISVDEVEVSGLSYTIDLTELDPGYTYGYNVVVDNHFSSPLLIELY